MGHDPLNRIENSTALLQETSGIAASAYIPSEVSTLIEETFYEKVSEQARLEYMRRDASFLKNPFKHIALFTDHGVVHVRDVANQVLIVLDRVNGKLIPERSATDLAFMRAYLVQLAYLHDIGMSDFSPFGRFMHPEFASQYVFSSAFNALLNTLWSKNAGGLPEWLYTYCNGSYQKDQLKSIYREMLALSVGHSKSKMPLAILNEPKRLQKHILNILKKPLDLLYLEQKLSKAREKLKRIDKEKKLRATKNEIIDLKKKIGTYKAQHTNLKSPLEALYQDTEIEPFSWLSSTSNQSRRLVLNVIDCIRCLRAADALRQRGTTLRTSAGYEIYVDSQTANAIYAIRDDESGELYLLEGNKTINAGEANLASSELDASGHLRVSFHLGAFRNQKITRKAARNLARVIDDIQADTVQSFRRNGRLDKGLFAKPEIPFKQIKILIESARDNPNFSEMVREALSVLNPEIAERTRVTFSLLGYDLEEVRRYLEGEPLSDYLKNSSLRKKLVTQLKSLHFDLPKGRRLPGEEDIHVIHLKAGDQLIKGGTPSGFVYFPFAEGLVVHPMGGYGSVPGPAWVPIGDSGVIRGSVRNADVMAEKDVTVFCVPRAIYLNQWYRPLSAKDLLKAWEAEQLNTQSGK